MQLLLFIASHALLFSAILLFIDMSWVFLIALYLKSNGIIDVAYGLAYVLVAATTLLNFGLHPLGAVATLLVCMWGLRLAIRIHERTRGKPEDFRYGTGLRCVAISRSICCRAWSFSSCRCRS
jgi:steroid 5-alpha reductase family enzyme